jgi:hypothetical protein
MMEEVVTDGILDRYERNVIAIHQRQDMRIVSVHGSHANMLLGLGCCFFTE